MDPIKSKWQDSIAQFISSLAYIYTHTWSSLVAQVVKNLPAMWETEVQPLGGEDPLEKRWQSTPVFLPGESHGQRSLEGYSPWGRKESDVCVCVCEYIFDVSLDSLEEYTNSVTWRVRLGRSDRGLHIFLPYILNNNQNVGGVLNKIKVALA